MKKYILACLFILMGGASLMAQKHFATISGNLDFLEAGSAVNATVFRYGLFDYAAEFENKYKDTVTGHYFRLDIPVETYPRFFDLALSAKRLEKNIFGFIAEAGDNVSIHEQDGRYYFSGGGSAKYNLIIQLGLIDSKWTRRLHYDDPELVRQDFLYKDSTAMEQLSCLDSWKGQISTGVYFLLKAGILCYPMEHGYYISRHYKDAASLPVIQALSSYRQDNRLKNAIAALKDSGGMLIYTQFYEEAVIEQYRLDSCYLLHKDFVVRDCYDYLARNYSGDLRDALVTWLIFHWKNSAADLGYCINGALSYVQFADFREMLIKLKASRLKGAAAFDFSLLDPEGAKVSYDSFKGKVVLLDFWYTGCPSCAQTAPYLANIESDLTGRPVAFISICIDKNKKTWLESLRRKTYTSAYSTNLYTGGNGKDDPVLSYYDIGAFPTLLLIDKQGKLCEAVGDPRSDGGRHLIAMINDALSR